MLRYVSMFQTSSVYYVTLHYLSNKVGWVPPYVYCMRVPFRACLHSYLLSDKMRNFDDNSAPMYKY